MLGVARSLWAHARTALWPPEQAERRAALAALEHATTLEEWEAAAHRLDDIDGCNEWKEEPGDGEEYDHELVLVRTAQLRDARLAGDIEQVLYLVRVTLTRNLGGLGNPTLYRHSNIGTKRIIEDYLTEVEASLQYLLDDDGRIPLMTKLDALVKTRQAYGRTALLLSGGGTFGMTHIGVVKTLWETNLLPRIISGSSAGAIVAAACCVRTDDEMPLMVRSFPYYNLDVFEDSHRPESIFLRIGRFLKHGVFFDITYLMTSMQETLGNITFAEAYNRTRRVLNITISSSGLYEMPRLLNYITAPNVLIWSAVAASCSVPMLFETSEIMAKDPITREHVPWNPSPSKYIDGSVDNDIPITRLTELFNINHFIVSQVNPHVVPFLEGEHFLAPSSLVHTQQDSWTLSGIVRENVARTLLSEVSHGMSMLAELGVLRTLMTKLRTVLNQTYTGDITVLPSQYFKQLGRLLSNPTPAFMLEACIRGQRAIWPKMCIIRNHCSIELALDEAIHSLRSSLVTSSGAVQRRKDQQLRYRHRCHRSQSLITGTPAATAGVNGHHGRRRHSRSAVENGNTLAPFSSSNNGPAMAKRPISHDSAFTPSTPRPELRRQPSAELDHNDLMISSPPLRARRRSVGLFIEKGDDDESEQDEDDSEEDRNGGDDNDNNDDIGGTSDDEDSNIVSLPQFSRFS